MVLSHLAIFYLMKTACYTNYILLW